MLIKKGSKHLEADSHELSKCEHGFWTSWTR